MADHDLLIRLDTKLQTALDEIREIKTGTNSRLDKVENRVDNLEKSKAYRTGQIVVLSAVSSVAVTIITAWIIKLLTATQ